MAFIHKETFEIYNDAHLGYMSFRKLSNLFEVDDLMAPIISKLNIKGYKTNHCCQGQPYLHVDDDYDNNVYMSVAEINNLSILGNIIYKIQPRTYISFEEGVTLPTIPDGWSFTKTYDWLVIEYMYNGIMNYTAFFKTLVSELEKLEKYVDSLPVCIESKDPRWNLYIRDILKIIPDLTNVEIDIVRKNYANGYTSKETIKDLVKF